MSKLYIIMPCINCFEMTSKAFMSIFSDIEWSFILIDNKSDDATQEWGKKNEIDKSEGIRPDRFIYIRNEQRKSVAQSWNRGIEIALKDKDCKYIAILNNDIILHRKTLTNLMAFMDKTGYLLVSADNIKDRMSIGSMVKLELPVAYTDYDTWKIEGWRAEGPDFSCYMISPQTIKTIGWFDENYLGAYCEDQDYHIRINLARKHAEQHNDLGIEAEKIHAKRLSTAPYYHFASQTIKENENIRNDIAVNHGHNENYYITKWGNPHHVAMDGNCKEQPFGDATRNWKWWEGVEKYEGIV